MTVRQRIKEINDDLVRIRRDIHAHPETAFEEVRTSELVARELESYGVEVHRGLAKTGVVGTLKAGTGNRAIGLRADMDALDMTELNDHDYKSTHDGKMHGCGHDGHTAMLLGAARYLSETKDFDGIVHFIFQPAEENVAGGRVMVEDGLFELFPVEAVYGLHNMPGLEVGKIGVRSGPVMASADFFRVVVRGVGGHGGFPHFAVDPVVIAAQVVTAWQTIVSRNTDPIQSAVISTTQIHGGSTSNVIPEEVELVGTTRAFLPQVRDHIESAMRRMAEQICAAHQAKCDFTYERRYPSVINTVDETELAATAAATAFGDDNVLRDFPPSMGAEDFSWMLQERPGCYVVLGNGTEKGGCHVHNPNYDFNDDIISLGVNYWAELVESQLKPR